MTPNHAITLPCELPPADQRTLNRLWVTLIEYGVFNPNDRALPPEPRQTSQLLPYMGDPREQFRAWLVESTFTGLFTSHRDVMLRAYVQAAGYIERMRGLGDEPGAYMHDCVSALRARVEAHFLYPND